MPLEISRNDIRNIKTEAIVDPTDRFLSGSGGTDYIIHEMAGEGLKKALDGISLEEGKALITESFDCENCDYIIHTCGPVYQDGNHNEEEILRFCYRKCLELARENELESIAFPLIASGSFAFPKGQALKIATDTITAFLLDNEMTVYLLVYDKESFDTAGKLFTDIRNYLDENLVVENRLDQFSYVEAKYQRKESQSRPRKKKSVTAKEKEKTVSAESLYIVQEEAAPSFEPDESFSECMIRMIDEKGYSDPDVYKKANIDRKLFNHIKNTKNYRPKKQTACALAIGMKLNIDEANTLLERAGFVLSNSSVSDMIIRYCIENGEYDIYRINEILYQYDQKLLGVL